MAKIVLAFALFTLIFYGFFVITSADISLSGNLSLYPGENGSFICGINTSLADVIFHWTKFLLDETDITVTLSDNADTTIGSASSISYYSTYNITNVNYTNNGIGFQCNALDSTSNIAYLTVLTPVILRIPLSITSLQVGDAINLTCIALGGPRLVLQWLKDNATIASGQMGISVLNFALNTTDNCDFGNYTCIVMIDDMLESYTTLVIPAENSSGNDQSSQAAVITLTIFLVIAIVGLITSVVINIVQRKKIKRSFTESNAVCTEMKSMPRTEDSKSDLMCEPVYEGITTYKSEPDYVCVTPGNLNTKPEYKGATVNPEQEPEYEAVSAYRRQEDIPPCPIYVNSLARPPRQ